MHSTPPKHEEMFIIWEKTLDQANTLFYQLPGESQALSKQMSVVMLSLADLPTSLHNAAQTNLKCQLEVTDLRLEHLLHDLIDAFAEAVEKLSDQGINVLKGSSTLKKRSLFRSSSQIHLFTHCLL